MEPVAKQGWILLIHETVKYYLAKVPSNISNDVEESTESESQSADAYTYVNAELELHGYYLGSKIVTRLTLGKGCIWDQNGCVIFVCKELWKYLFGTNASRLQSNSQVTTGLPKGVKDPTYKRTAKSNEYKMHYLHLIAGIVRGALASLGLRATVVPSIEATYVFKVYLQG
ncbi:hypothetical protein X943_001223 [Babesia divergens]|uniref:Trafficking protein particle complex subunit 6B n=1 Tax=Babesia divergens TaxID=32595 RepID=A0AAD9G6T3_BABDI|nr:hypothetical protein X943_001223 [Babesia divergens]